MVHDANSPPPPNAFDPFIFVVVSIVLVILFAIAIHFRPKPQENELQPKTQPATPVSPVL